MIRPTDFIDLAARLAARPQAKEAELRTAIGRAYYGAAHLARQTMEAVGLKLQVSLHELHRYLSNSGHESARGQAMPWPACRLTAFGPTTISISRWRGRAVIRLP